MKSNSKLSYDTLLKACNSGDVNKVRSVIIEHGSIINQGVLLEVFASRSLLANTELATLLLEYVTDINYHTNKHSFLNSACEYGDITLVQMILDRGAIWYENEAYNYYWMMDALSLAASGGSLDVIKLLVDSPLNRSCRHISENCIKNAFISASIEGHIDLILYFITYGVDRDVMGEALCHAVRWEKYDAIVLLINNNADINFSNIELHSPLYIACNLENYDIVRLLLTHGADPNMVDNKRGKWGSDMGSKSPLFRSLWWPEMAKLLLNSGADPDQCNEQGVTALLLMAQRHIETYYDSFELLLQHGADPNRNHPKTGDTALTMCARCPSVRVFKLLLEHGADVTHTNYRGESALDLLTESSGNDNRYTELIQLCNEYKDRNMQYTQHILK